jgi:hypothetical protein
VVEKGAERVISYRAAEHATLCYSFLDGRLKIGGVARTRCAELAEIFARTMLDRPGFFASPSAQQLYTLAPIERAGLSFRLTHAYDTQIRQVQIVEAQANRMGIDPRTGEERILRSAVSRDSEGEALAWLGDREPGLRFGAGAWRLSHIVIRVHLDVGERRVARVTVKLKPPARAMFRRQRFEDQIMTLLRRNGLCHERDADFAAVAAE